MRITQPLIHSFIARSNGEAQNALMESLERVSSGRSINRISDNPAGARQVSQLSRLNQRLDTIEGVRNATRSDLSLADAAMMDATQIMMDANELAIEMASDGRNASDRAAAASEVAGMIEGMVALGNRQAPSGYYLFGGVADREPPYAADGQYVGSAVNRQVEVAPGRYIDATMTADETFLASGVSAFDALSDLERALQNDDVNAVAVAIEQTRGSIEALTTSESRVGTRLKALDEAETISNELGIRLIERRAEISEIDLVEEASQASSVTVALQRAMQVSQQLLDLYSGNYIG